MSINMKSFMSDLMLQWKNTIVTAKYHIQAKDHKELLANITECKPNTESKLSGLWGFDLTLEYPEQETADKYGYPTEITIGWGNIMETNTDFWKVSYIKSKEDENDPDKEFILSFYLKKFHL